MGLFDDLKDKLNPAKKKNDFQELEVPAESPSFGKPNAKGDIELQAPSSPEKGIDETAGFKALGNQPPIEAPGAPVDLPPLPEDEPTQSLTPALEQKGLAPQSSDSSSKADIEIIKAKLEAVNAKLDRIAEMLNSMKNQR